MGKGVECSELLLRNTLTINACRPHSLFPFAIGVPPAEIDNRFSADFGKEDRSPPTVDYHNRKGAPLLTKPSIPLQ